MPKKSTVKRPVQRVLLPREGFRDVGDQIGHVKIATNVFGKKRKPLHEETR